MAPNDPPAYEHRDRAESFGAVADQYDRYRPSYPDQLIADLIDLDPEWTLDVACGTGKVAVPLLACGLAVLGVEVDPKMAEVARRHGIIVEIGSFEDWDDNGRTFDLITCGQGWHWIQPDVGAKKAARLLNAGGTLALFWNHGEVDGTIQRELDEVYRQHAPELALDARKHKHDDATYVESLKASGGFADVRIQKYRWDATLTSDEWIHRIATHSDHLALAETQRAELLDAVHEVIERHNGSITLRSGTHAIFARTPEK